jgi:hypothetical protein
VRCLLQRPYFGNAARGGRVTRVGGAAVPARIDFMAHQHARRGWLAVVTVIAAMAVAALPSRSSAQAAGPVDFGRDVLPILSDKCYHCHGPDEQARKAKLRLDTKDGAFHVREKRGSAVIVPGKPGESELVRRITSNDPDERMPPPASNRTLTPQQVETLRRWVEQGAKWGEHWSLVAPKKVAPPATKRSQWPHNPIDAFVLARLEKAGLAPAPEADKATLIRRVTLDLTGLPPTPREVDAFLRDNRPDAYERLVDRLLASPRYGERMAADWLDLARYADTHGYQMDRYRAAWPYRDWVIRAFNQNLPFDRFVTWQLAGDLLPNATKDQRLATGFNRLHMQNEEGGIVEEEFRVAYVVDRVDTFGTALLGLTFECSRCHDHKYDPITQKDFYSLFAFFQNIDESGQTSYFTDAMPVPTLLLSTDAQDAKLAEMKGRIESKSQELEARRPAAKDEFAKWLKGKPGDPELPGLVAAYDFEKIDGGKVANAVDSTKPGTAVEGPGLTEGKHGRAADLSGDNGFTFPGVGHFSRADAFSLAIWLGAPSPAAPRAVVVHHSKAPIDAGSRGYELLLEDGRVAVGLHHMWPGNSLKVVTRRPVPLDEWAHVAVTYDGSSRAAGVRVYVNGDPAELEVVRDRLNKDITYSGGEPDLAIGYRFRDNGFKNGRVDDFRIFNRAITPIEAAHLAGRNDLTEALKAVTDALTPAQRDSLFDYFLSTADAPSKQLTTELHVLRKEWVDFINPIPETMVMQEMREPRPAHVLKRGAYDAPGEEVHAATPASLPPFPAGQPRNRLGLARWLLAPENPLTARVAVNRLWQQMFGRGIVETSENFGSQGSPPTHPQLLNWFARTYADDLHWDTKAMLKTIACSATYRQSSRASADLLARDPDNRLLARGPARRLTAEMLRDQALALSGLLTEQLGGPSVKPYQPDGLWDVAMGRPKYDQSHGPDLYRRSLYTFWKRTVPPPAMVVFDAADRSYCTARRQTTTTPLQSLALLNDVQLVEAARHVAGRMMKEGGATTDERLAWAYRLVTGHKPTAKEAQVLRLVFDEQQELFTRDVAAAKKLLSVGESKSDATLDPADLAAGTVLAQALLNFDDAVMRR